MLPEASVPAQTGEARMSKRVLVVDDEPNIVMSLEFLMRRAGFEVAIARNGKEALDGA